MTKHLWCWGDIINPELAEKALCAEAEREKVRAAKRVLDSRDAKPQPAAA